jgi:hypothetical protein
MIRRFHRACQPWRNALLGAVSVLLIHTACSSTIDDAEQRARQEIARVYPGWELVTAKDLANEDFSKWSADHPGIAPGFGTGDYFGDGRNAYSALITREDDRGQVVRLVVLGMTPSGRFESYAIFSESPVERLPAIFTSQAGEYQVFVDDQVSKTLLLDRRSLLRRRSRSLNIALGSASLQTEPSCLALRFPRR